MNQRSHPGAPALIAAAGAGASYRFLEFFTARIGNPHTRRAYARAAAEFFWAIKPFQGSRKTLAPRAAHSASVPSRTSSLRTTMTSAARSDTLSSARPIRPASAPEIMQTETGSLAIAAATLAEWG